MDHAPLDGPRTHDGDFDDEVVPAAGAETREHRHLGAALDLEDTDGIGRAKHVVDGVVALWNVGQCEHSAKVMSDEVIAAPNTREHAESENVDLDESDGLDVVFVPLQHGAIDHRGGRDRAQVDERTVGNGEPSAVEAEVAWVPAKLGGNLDGEVHSRVGVVETGLPQVLLLNPTLVEPVYISAQLVDLVLRQAERLPVFFPWGVLGRRSTPQEYTTVNVR